MTELTEQDIQQDDHQEQRFLRKRYRRDRRFKLYCIAALLFAVAFLLFFMFDLVRKGYTALWEARVQAVMRHTEASIEQPKLSVTAPMRDIVSREPMRLMPSQLQKRPKAEVHVFLDMEHDMQNGDPAAPLAAIQPPPGLEPFTDQQSRLITSFTQRLFITEPALRGVSAEQVRQLIGPKGIEEISDELNEEFGAQTEGDFHTPGERFVWASDAVDQYLKKKQSAANRLTQSERASLELDPALQHAVDLLQNFKEYGVNKPLARRKYDHRMGTSETRWMMATSRIDQYLKGKRGPLRTDSRRLETYMDVAGYELALAPPWFEIDERTGTYTPTPAQFRKLADELKDADIQKRGYDLENMAVNWAIAQQADRLHEQGRIKFVYNTNFFTSGDSTLPEAAGIWPAIVGSVYVLGIVLACSFPLGVLTAIYLEEFAPDNKFTQAIEVNINNLAAIPSILFGLLGLAVFINLPRTLLGIDLRSTALVGGLTLTLMTLPVVIISARAALRAVPDSIRLGAMAMGATRWQTVCHHVVPQSLSGMLTGTIIGLAQAMGETAPLIMIGMIAFFVEAPSGITDGTTVMPAQIYSWFDNSQTGYEELAAAGILVLLAVLMSMNLVAVLLRARFEKRW